MDNKDLLKKLLKVAKNQQKIIKKLAQLSGRKNVTDKVNEIIGKLNLPLGTVCLDAQLSELDKKLEGKIKLPNGKPGDLQNRKVLDMLSVAVANSMNLQKENVKFVLVFGDMVS